MARVQPILPSNKLFFAFFLASGPSVFNLPIHFESACQVLALTWLQAFEEFHAAASKDCGCESEAFYINQNFVQNVFDRIFLCGNF